MFTTLRTMVNVESGIDFAVQSPSQSEVCTKFMIMTSVKDYSLGVPVDLDYYRTDVSDGTKNNEKATTRDQNKSSSPTK